MSQKYSDDQSIVEATQNLPASAVSDTQIVCYKSNSKMRDDRYKTIELMTRQFVRTKRLNPLEIPATKKTNMFRRKKIKNI